MEQSSPSAPASRGASQVEAAVIQPGGAYAMFDAGGITPEGALLSGGLLLEIGEEFLLELRLGSAPVRVRARVLAIVPGDQAAMQVAWIELDDATRQRLARGV